MCVLGFSVIEMGQLIMADSGMQNNFEIIAKALEDKPQEEPTVANTF